MIYTASFNQLRKLDNYCQLAVSSGIPNWYKGGRYKKLAPSFQLVCLLKASQQQAGGLTKEDIERFSATYYEEVLSKLDPKKVYEDLCSIAGNNPIVLLSHEAADEYSVRFVIKAWFENAGIECEEIF